jgi:hypothetical protein
MLIRDNYIVGRSFYYDLKIESIIRYDCKSYGCDEEEICRCGQIDRTKIKNIKITSIVDKIYEDIYGIDDKSTKRDNKLSYLLEGFGKEMNLYTIDRILRIYKVYDPKNWIVEVEGGYYGQEIGDVIINDDLAKKLEEKIFEALSIDSLTERVEYLLNLEYGSILPELQDSLYEIMDVKKDDLYFGSISNKKSTLKEIEKSSTEFYGYYYDDMNYGRDSIKGIVIEKDGKYRVIDGYHRCLASERKYLKVLISRKIYE